MRFEYHRRYIVARHRVSTNIRKPAPHFKVSSMGSSVSARKREALLVPQALCVTKKKEKRMLMQFSTVVPRHEKTCPREARGANFQPRGRHGQPVAMAMTHPDVTNTPRRSGQLGKRVRSAPSRRAPLLGPLFRFSFGVLRSPTLQLEALSFSVGTHTQQRIRTHCRRLSTRLLAQCEPTNRPPPTSRATPRACITSWGNTQTEN